MRRRRRPVAARPDRRRECRPDAFRQRAVARGGGGRSRGQKERGREETARGRKFGGRTWPCCPRCAAGRKGIGAQVGKTSRASLASASSNAGRAKSSRAAREL